MDQDRNVGYTSAMPSVVPNPSLFVSLCVLHVSVAETAYASDTRHLSYVSILWRDWQPHLDKHSILRIHQNLGVKRDKRQCGSIQQFVTHPICVADTMQCPGVKLLSMQLHIGPQIQQCRTAWNLAWGSWLQEQYDKICIYSLPMLWG